MRDQAARARFLWLPPGLRPPVDPVSGPMVWRQERVFLLVGLAALFAGYDQNVYGMAVPQIQAAFHIPENNVGLTVAYFRVAAILSLLIAASADLVGRRRLLLITITGQAAATLATAFTATYDQFVLAQIVTRIFGYAEEMLCYVVIAEEVAAGARGWAAGTLSAMEYSGAGFAALVFGAVNLLPFGWRALYVIGAAPLFLVAYLRRSLPETQRFAAREKIIALSSRSAETIALLRDLVREYPARLAAMLVAVGSFGFALAPATVLASKYLQSVHHYTPGQVSLLLIPGGSVGLGLAILVGRASDRIGRRPVTAAVVALAGLGFYFFYGNVGRAWLPPFWVLGFFGFFSGEALIAGFALEIVPTRYRATVSGLRYLAEIGAGAAALALEGRLYDIFHGHGPAIQWLLAALPLSLLAILFLPEPAGKSLEEMTA